MKKTTRSREKNISASLATRKKSSGLVRIVGGAFRRTPIKVMDLEGLRPTPSRVRETFFDWITHLLGGCEGRAVCDMFSGSGALGLEAASRGATRVLCIERNREAARAIKEVVTRLNATDAVEVLCADAMERLGALDETFDLIFIDPPFASALQCDAASLARKRIRPEGLICVESDKEITEESFSKLGLTVLRQAKAGNEFYFVLKPVFP